MRIGEVRVDAVADGTFVARPSYFGADVPAGAHPEVFDRDGAAELPRTPPSRPGSRRC